VLIGCAAMIEKALAPRNKLLDQEGRDVMIPVPGKSNVLIFYRGYW